MSDSESEEASKNRIEVMVTDYRARHMVWDDAERARLYIESCGPPDDPVEAHGFRMSRAAEHVEGATLLDIPCGVGHLYPLVRDRVEYTGADLSAEMLRHARESFPDATFIEQDIFDLSGMERFDAVVCLSLLLHLPDPRLAIEQLWARTGRVLILGFKIDEDGRRWDKPVGEKTLLLRGYPLEEALGMVSDLEGVTSVSHHTIEVKPNGNTCYVVARR